MRKFFLLLVIIVSLSSCEKDNDDKEFTSAIVEDVIKPPEAPSVYLNSSVEPEVKIRNNGTIEITSIAISYSISINNNGSVISVGPTTTWFGSIEPQNDAVIVLDKWDGHLSRPPLSDGTHMLYINILQINTESYFSDNNDLFRRLFILEE